MVWTKLVSRILQVAQKEGSASHQNALSWYYSHIHGQGIYIRWHVQTIIGKINIVMTLGFGPYWL